MIITFLIAIFFAKFRGCEIKPAFNSIALYPPFICEFIYLILQIFLINGNYSVVEFADVFKRVYLLSFLFPIIMLNLYKPALIGSAFIVVGTAMNNFVIALNNGKMPVFPSLSYLTGYVKSDSFQKISDIHILGSTDTKMMILSDIIDVGWSVLSIGDILIRVFAAIIVYSAIVELNKKNYVNFVLKPIFQSDRHVINRK